MAPSEAHTITVPAEIVDQVQARVSQGAYATDGDVLRASVCSPSAGLPHCL